MSRDVRRDLEEAGRRAAPDPDPAFADALGARLLAIATSVPSQTPPEPPRRRRSPRWSMGMIAAGLAAVALVLATVVAPARPGPTPSVPSLELTATVNVEVQLADGTIVENPDGLLLPDGAVVKVGDGGSARIGDLVLGAGEVVSVRNGRAHVDQPGGTATGPIAGRPTARPSPPRTPSSSPRPSPGPGTPAPSPRPSPPPTRVPASPPPGRSATPGPVSPPPSPAPTSVTAPTPSPTPIRSPRIAARLVGPRTIAVDWMRTPGARTYVLVVTRSTTGAARRPTYPGGRILGRFAHPPAAPLRFRVGAPVVQVKLMVVALDRDGHELARSRVVRIAVPPIATAPAATAPAATAPAATPSAAT